MAQATPQELHLMTRLASDPQLIQWLQSIAGEHLATCGTAPKDIVELHQGKYQAIQDLLTKIQRGSAAYQQHRSGGLSLDPTRF